MTDKRQIDLHIHSTASDGYFNLDEIIEIAQGQYEGDKLLPDAAQSNQIAAIAITDHDTIHPQLEKRIESQEGLEIISGSEIKTELQGLKLEVLGYFLDPDNKELTNMLQTTERKRKERMKKMICRFNDLEVKVEGERVQIDPQEFIKKREDSAVGRPHLGRELVSRGVVDNLQQAFTKYLGDDQPCYLPVPRPSCEQVIDTIHQAGGLAFLAHPCFYRWQLDQFKQQLPLLKELGLDGVEVFYPYQTIKRDKKMYLDPSQVEPLVENNELLKSGGSDFHSFEDSQLGRPFVNYSLLEAMKREVELPLPMTGDNGA